MNHRELIRCSTLLVVMAAHAVLSEGAAQWEYLTTTAAVNLGSWVTVVGAFYMWGGYMLCKRPVMKNPPPLTTETVYVYVYGLGFLLFVATYSGLGCTLNVAFTFAVGLGGVCVDDILALKSETRTRRLLWGACVALSLGAVSTLFMDVARLALFSTGVDTGSAFEIGYGFVLPLATPFLFHLVRAPPPTASTATSLHSPRVGPSVILELLHIGAPLAIMLATFGAFALGTPAAVRLPSQRLANLTLEEVVARTLTPEGATGVQNALFLAFLPLTTALWLFFLVQSVILYRTTEFLALWALVCAVRHCLHDMTALTAQIGCVLAFKCLLILLCMGQTGPANLVKLQQTAAYADEEDATGTVLLFQPEGEEQAVV